MLTPRRRPVRMLLVAAAAVASSFVGVTLTTSPASAGDCTDLGAIIGGGVTCTQPGTPGTPGNPGDSGGNGPSTPPPCDLDVLLGAGYDNPSAPYCKGLTTCQVVDLFAPVAMPAGDKPKEDSKARVEICRTGGSPIAVGTAFWSDDEEPPTLLQQAQTAVGLLDFLAPTVGVSPPTRTLVNLDTWFWLDGAQAELSASAFTLTVTARLSSITVDPGDGTGAFRCDPIPMSAAQAEDSCVHAYRKASSRGSATVSGRPAYQATVSSVYDLTYTNGGNVVDIPGAQVTIEGLPGTAAVRVDEVQTLSRPNSR